MTPELQQKFDEASRPFHEGGGAIGLEQTRLNAWRYFLEINSVCNLHCPTCTKGNQEGYEHQTGVMDFVLMMKILDKIKSENPNAIVFLYGNSEPFLHPALPECIRAVKVRGLHPEMSTNLNVVKRLDDVLAAGLDMMIVSLSGFTQEVYEKGHAGGKIGRVKDNMVALSAANARAAKKVNIAVNYHVYTDNEHEIAPMKEFAEGLGFNFFTSLARAISMENAIQYCRSKDAEATPFEVQPDRPDWNRALPPVGETYIQTMERLRIPPTQARAMYDGLPKHPVCPVNTMFRFIRHDGKTSLCACVADRRITIGDYLHTSADDLALQSINHSICQQCLKYRLSYYFHIVDREKWNP